MLDNLWRGHQIQNIEQTENSKHRKTETQFFKRIGRKYRLILTLTEENTIHTQTMHK